VADAPAPPGRPTSRRLRLGRSALVLLALWCPPAGAQLTIDAVPGGVVEIPLGPLSGDTPQAFFGQRRVLVRASGSEWVGVVGLRLSLLPGRYVVRTGLDDHQDPVAHEFTVFPRRVEERPLIRALEPPPDTGPVDLAWRDTLAATLPLAPPLALPAQPVFGRHLQRPDGGSQRVDFVVFEVASDTGVKAPDAGRVAAIRTHRSGVYVWIDHGMALFTRTGPLSRAAVSPDDAVETGQSLGRLALDEHGTPRTLYWSVFLNGAAVNPFLLSDLDRAPLPEAGPGPD